MCQAEIGNIVRVHYTARLETGSIIDTSRDREPLAGKTLVFELQLFEIVK